MDSARSRDTFVAGGRVALRHEDDASGARAATPWGAATLVEELRLPQQAGDKRFASLVAAARDREAASGSSASPTRPTASPGAGR